MRRKGNFMSSSLVAIVIGLIISGLTMVIAVNQSMLGTSQTDITSSANKVEEVQEHISQVCKNSNSQETDLHLVKEHDFKNVGSISIKDSDLRAQLNDGGSLRKSLNEDCSYSWSGIEPENTAWELNVSADHSSGPKVTVEAERK